MQKNAAWLAQARSQGDIFFALCHEVGGRPGRGCEIFLDQLCSVAAASPSERMAFRIYALQRLHAATFRGVAMLINSRPVMRTGPEVPSGVFVLGCSGGALDTPEGVGKGDRGWIAGQGGRA